MKAANVAVLAQLVWPFRGSGEVVLRGVRSLARRVLLAAVGTIGFGSMTGFTLLPFGTTTQPLGTVATVAVPRRAELEAARPAIEQPTWVGFRMDRFHAWAMGSGTPYRATLFIVLHAPDAGPRSYDEARVHCERALNGGGDDWRDLRQDERWRIGQGRYTVNLLDEPIWRLAYRDPERRVSALWQVYQRDWDLAAAEAALAQMVASVRRLHEPAWAEITDRPRRAAAEAGRKADAAFAWLAARGFTPLAPERPVTRDGITVEYMAEPERRLMLLRLLDGPPTAALPPWVSTGTRTWSEAGWQDRMANHDYYPMPGTRRELDRTLAKPGPHHFIIRTIRLDELAEEDFHLADFFAEAARYGDPARPR